MANKPRNSVLYLFDPLESMSTPRRDGSPDSSSSDKENDIQPGEVTMFFNRIYTSQKDAAPKTPNGKLIDFGDTTADDICGLEEEDAAASPVTVLDTTKQSVEINTDRIPLADIEIEDILEPVCTEEPLATSLFHGEEDTTPLRAVSAAPSGAPLADVINSINLSALHISGSAPPSPLANRSPLPPLKEEADADFDDSDEEFEAPQGAPEDTVCIPLLITVSSPTGTYEESNSLTDLVLPPSSESPTDRLFASSNVDLPPPTRRPLLRTRVANGDPRRASVDLQSSFSMQMQSEEMSFDLLNDGISFQAGDSMWAGGDDEDDAFDMVAEMKKMEAAANAFERTEQGKIDDIAMELDAASVSSPEEQTHANEWAQPLLEVTAAHSSIIDQPQPPASSPIIETPPKVFQVAPSSTSSNSGTLTKHDRSLSVLMLAGSPSPAPVFRQLSPPPAPAPVPALRILKKTWKVHGRTDSGTSSGSSVSSGSTNTSTSRARSTSPDTSVASESVTSLKEEKVAPTPAPDRARPQTVVRGVQRPPAGAEIMNNRVVVAPPPTGPARTTAPTTAQAKSRASLAREASARFAAAGLQRPNLQQGQRAPPPAQTYKAPATAAAARAQRTAASSAPPAVRPTSIGRIAGAGVAARIAGTSGLKAPTASGIPSSKSSSALPRPASRLPAPSAGARSTKTSAPAARIPSAGARRAF